MQTDTKPHRQKLRKGWFRWMSNHHHMRCFGRLVLVPIYLAVVFTQTSLLFTGPGSSLLHLLLAGSLMIVFFLWFNGLTVYNLNKGLGRDAMILKQLLREDLSMKHIGRWLYPEDASPRGPFSITVAELLQREKADCDDLPAALRIHFHQAFMGVNFLRYASISSVFLGLLGTVMGIQGALEQGLENVQLIFPHLSLALRTTILGLVIMLFAQAGLQFLYHRNLEHWQNEVAPLLKPAALVYGKANNNRELLTEKPVPPFNQSRQVWQALAATLLVLLVGGFTWLPATTSPTEPRSQRSQQKPSHQANAASIEAVPVNPEPTNETPTHSVGEVLAQYRQALEQTLDTPRLSGFAQKPRAEEPKPKDENGSAHRARQYLKGQIPISGFVDVLPDRGLRKQFEEQFPRLVVLLDFQFNRGEDFPIDDPVITLITSTDQLPQQLDSDVFLDKLARRSYGFAHQLSDEQVAHILGRESKWRMSRISEQARRHRFHIPSNADHLRVWSAYEHPDKVALLQEKADVRLNCRKGDVIALFWQQETTGESSRFKLAEIRAIPPRQASKLLAENKP